MTQSLNPSRQCGGAAAFACDRSQFVGNSYNARMGAQTPGFAEKSIMIADQLREAQAYGERRTTELGIDPAQIPARIQEFLKNTRNGHEESHKPADPSGAHIRS
jgi:hypothetical protein